MLLTPIHVLAGNLAGWNAFNWEFQAGFYPTLKSYKVDSSNAQIAGIYSAGNYPKLTSFSVLLRLRLVPPQLLEKGGRAFFWE